MPDLTRRPDPHRANSWLIHYGDVHVGTISKCVGNPNAEPQWQWLCGFYPGRGEQCGGTAPDFETAREAFTTAWLRHLARCTEADFQAWRDQRDWTAEKYRRRDRGERMPPDWLVGEMRPPQG